MRTERLLLRRWQAQDREPFAAMNADPVVMEHFPATLTREQSDALVTRLEARFERDGFGLWAVQELASGRFIGFNGLMTVDFETPFTPAVEIGWRLAVPAWGNGYATEGARAALGAAFGTLGLDEVVSFTTPQNVRSQRVMRAIGMQRDAGGDFDHPLVTDPVLRRHVLYRIGAAQHGSS